MPTLCRPRPYLQRGSAATIGALCNLLAAIEKLLADLARSGCAATRVGRIVAGAGARVHDASGKVIDTPRAGWQHFTA